jgi:hypothetical protein
VKKGSRDTNRENATPVGTLGGGRETLDGIPELASIDLKFVEACSAICRF